MISLSESEGNSEVDDEPLPSSPEDAQVPARGGDGPASSKQAEKTKERGDPMDEDKAWVPQRVTDVLKKSSSFAEFRSQRVFQFLHLFSGQPDVLGEVITEVCHRENLRVGITSIDRDHEKRFDLMADQPFGDIMDDIRGGLYDGAHAGFPCGSFSMVRYRPGGPAPVRSLAHIYGLPTNSTSQQREADRGTVLACRALQAVGEQVQSQRLRRIPDAGTLENPPGSDTQAEGPAWKLPEFLAFMDKMKTVEAVFNTCAYQMKERKRWFKPAKFAGLLAGLGSLKRQCQCPQGFKHDSLIGKEKTSAAARYPRDLCLAYAELLVKTFKTTLNLEWWRYMEGVKQQEVNTLQRNWASSKVKSSSGPPMDHESLTEFRQMKRAWGGLGDVEDKLPMQVQPSKKQRREEENRAYLGGMRNPQLAIKRMKVLAEAGQDVYRLWRSFVKDRPEALTIADTYGSERCQLDTDILTAWKERLSKLIKVEKANVVLKSKIMFESPLDADLWRAWRLFSKDPEDQIHVWAKCGVPLGMAQEIPSSNGIFPPVFESRDIPEVAPAIEAQLDTINYKSMYEDREPATKELERLVEKGFAVIMDKTEAKEMFKTGTMSRLALIAKAKENYIKYRIIIDMLRSGGNQRCQVPERIVLPRLQDIVQSCRDLWALQSDDMKKEDSWDVELIGADLSDAYCHFAVAADELSNCLAPAMDESKVVCFRAMLFGFKAAPLIMGRLAACFTRQWQSFLPRHVGFIQTYMDDPFMVLMGKQEERRALLALILYTAKAFGLNLAFNKAERGTQLKWIGVNIELDKRGEKLILTVPDKLVEEVRKVMEEWKSVISLRELRAVTGRLSWLAGVLTKARWAVPIMYAVIASAERAKMERDNKKTTADPMEKQRDKRNLVHTKRVELPRRFFMHLFDNRQLWMTRKIPLREPEVKWAFTTDASPLGIGGILSAVDMNTQVH